MRSVWIPRIGPPEVLEVREIPDPHPRAGEVRVRVRASGVNFADCMARMGLYPDAPKLPCVVGYEIAGTLDEIGHGAAGGVGLAAVQLARIHDAEVIGTASASKHAALRAAGVAHTIDYRTADVEVEIRRLTGGRGVDIVLDPIGGENLRRSYRALA